MRLTITTLLGRHILYCLLILLPSLSSGQDIEFAKAIANTQGIKQSKVIFYDSEGYTISVEKMDYKFNEKGIAKTKKRYNIPKKVLHTISSDTPDAYIFNTIDTHENFKYDRTYYFTPLPDGKIKVTGFLTYSDRIPEFEAEFLKLIVTDSVPDSVYTPQQVGTIIFAGREIALGPACKWMEVRNIQCSGMGQMSWSEFSSLKRARQMIDGKKARNASLRMGETIEDLEVNVIFEGKEVTAIRRTSKIKVPKIMMGGSNSLIIYYVVTEVRGRFVACVLSHYSDEANEGTVPALLSEVMKL